MKGSSYEGVRVRILSIKNLSCIQEARVHLGGISVIAGENDTGKSTVGKVLMALIKADNAAHHQKKTLQETWPIFCRRIFAGELYGSAEVEISQDGADIYRLRLRDGNCENFTKKSHLGYKDCTFIAGPLVLDLLGFFDAVHRAEGNASFLGEGMRQIPYPYLSWDLYFKSYQPMRRENKKMQRFVQDIAQIIGGHFARENPLSAYKFYKNHQKFSMENVATGIKQFGILQILLHNNRITPRGFLIFDEPENHLHPIWQLKFAEILVLLSRQDIPILIHSHSPNFLEALYRYGKRHEARLHFHFAREGRIEKVGDDERTLDLIYERLNSVFHTLHGLG